MIGSDKEHGAALDEAASLTLGSAVVDGDMPTTMAAYTSEQQARVAL